MQYIFVQTTKHHLFSASLSKYTQPNMTALHVLSLSHMSLALRYEPGSTATRTKQTLSVSFEQVWPSQIWSNEKNTLTLVLWTLNDFKLKSFEYQVC